MFPGILGRERNVVPRASRRAAAKEDVRRVCSGGPARRRAPGLTPGFRLWPDVRRRESDRKAQAHLRGEYPVRICNPDVTIRIMATNGTTPLTGTVTQSALWSKRPCWMSSLLPDRI